MVFTNYSDGQILTAGSVNYHWNTRPVFVAINGSKYTYASSGTNVTLNDHYITSGTLHPTQQIMVFSCWELNAVTLNAIPIIAIGPSGTSPTLVTIGSVADNSINNTLSFFAIGSTTVDSATPALIRFSALKPENTVTDLQNYQIMGIRPS